MDKSDLAEMAGPSRCLRATEFLLVLPKRVAVPFQS
jgi:hypothetical protein